MTTTQDVKKARTHDIPTRAIIAALLAALVRLGIITGVAACLLIILLNEVTAALLYVIAATLALFFSH